MKCSRNARITLALATFVSLGAGDGARAAGDADSPPRLRVVIETDAPGGDPDDEGSLVRFFLYLNEWDVEGIIGTRSPKDSRLGISGKDRILQYADAYGKVYVNLRLHAEGYPDPGAVRRIVKQCHEGDEGRDFALGILDRDDPRPIWYLNWGTNEPDRKPTALREALDWLKARRKGDYERLARKLCYAGVPAQKHLEGHYEKLGFHMDTFYPTMDGGRWYHRWRPLTEKAGGFDIGRDVRKDHGPLCANYTITKEGDTPTFTHLIPNGLNVPGRPEWGGWAGRYGFDKDQALWWCDQRDTWRGTTSRDHTLARWAEHIQNDLRARADWCVADRFEKANHPPRPVLEGDRSDRALNRRAPAGTELRLSAAGTSDPDGNGLRYEWFIYLEAGTYGGEMVLDGADGPACALRIPDDAAGRTIHVVLQVTDDGDPPLTRYRRAVVGVMPG